MSSHKFNLIVSPLAQQDIDDIFQYTLETWGERQLEKYGDILKAAMSGLTENPRIGTEKRGTPFRSFHVGSHTIFYKIGEKAIHIIRVLHESMDFPRHVPSD